MYHPDFRSECRCCGTCPTVIVEGHCEPNTQLCGPCFFGDRAMIDWTAWNEQQESTE